MPISFPFPPSSGQRYDYLSQSWIYNGTYWASVRASGSVTSGQLDTPVVFSGNIASGQIGADQLASGIGGGSVNLTSGIITSGYIGNNAVTSGNIASGQIGQYHIKDFNLGTLTTTRGGNQGYFAGGNSGNYAATTDKITYINDTTSAQTTANLSLARDGLAGVSQGTTKGYFAGGFAATGRTATTDKTIYSNDVTAAQTTANLSQARQGVFGCSGEGIKGYFAGGFSTNFSSLTDKITYSTDTTAAQTTANLSQARTDSAGVSDGYTKGYFVAGLSFGNLVSDVADKITYSTDTTAAQTTANVSQARTGLAGVSENSTKGYFLGGTTNPSSTGSTVLTADKITYSTDTTTAQTTANLSQARYGLAGVSQGMTKGYFAGGATELSSNVATADKITYSNDTTAAQTTANISQARIYLAGAGQEFTSVFAYNSVNSGNISSSQLGINHFASGTFLSSGQVQSGNFGDSSIISGNIASGQISTNSFASGTLSLNSGQVRSGMFGNNSVNSGNISSSEIGQYHFAFNYLPSGIIQSGDFGDSAVTSGNIASGQITPIIINDITGQNNIVRGARGGIKGYFVGGLTSTTGYVVTADKITYSNDTTAAQTSANLGAAQAGFASVSDNITKGYLAGGRTTGGGTVATAYRLIYSSDTSLLQASANLSSARYTPAGCNGDGSKGYFAGGNTGAAVSVATADKITFSNDTTAAQTTANLSQARWAVGGISENLTKGYFAGGTTTTGATVMVATTDKIVFSNDTTAAQTTADLSQARRGAAGCSGEGTKGYFAGGDTGLSVVTTDKVIYSTDITTAQTTANLSSIRYAAGGISEGSIEGYFAGGDAGAGSPTVSTNKITYSNDTTIAQASANLSQARFAMGSVGQEYSYVFGDNSVLSGNISSGQISQYHLSSGAFGSGGIASGMFADNSVVSGSILSGRISSFQLGTESVTSGSITSGSVRAFTDGTINSGLIYSGGISVTALASGALYSFAFGDQSVNSGDIQSGRIGSPHIASGEIDDFNIASGAINASGKFNSGSILYINDGTLLSGNFGALFIGNEQFANDAIESGNIASGSIGNTSIASGGVISGNIASGEISQFKIASGAVNSGHFGDNSLSSGSFNFGCVDGNSLTSGLWTIPFAQYVSGGITAYMFNNNSIKFNNFGVDSYSDAGYLAGGLTGPLPYVITTYKITYATDTIYNQVTANITQERITLNGCSGDGKKGYFAGGYTGTVVNTTEKITYSNDTTAAQTSANLSQARYGCGVASDSTTKGYFAGGSTALNIATTTADKITYSNDVTTAQTSANISLARYGLAGCNGEGTKGYFVGGISTGGGVTTAEKITYSNDTTAVQTSANLSQGRYYLAGVSEGSTKGYFAGGNAGTIVATTDKITFSTDATAAQTSANLTQARWDLAGISQVSTKGYFVGGTTGFSNATIVRTADKITYATDTTVAQTSVNLNVATEGLAGVDGGSAPFVYDEIVTSGKLTTTALNEIRSTNLANNSVFSGQFSSNNIAIFSVVGGYTPFARGVVRSGNIISGEVGPFVFAKGTVLSGNLSSGLIYLPEALGDQMRSGNLAPAQINSGHFSSNDFIVTSSMIGSGQLSARTSSGQNAGPLYPFAETAQINAINTVFDYFMAGELLSGITAVCLASGNLVRRAERASGLRLPAIGVLNGTLLSGTYGAIVSYGPVTRTNSGVIASGFQGRPLYVGSGGRIVNLSGFMGGTSSGAPFLSGDMQQQIGIAISGGLFVMPSPMINRSGFQGTLPFNY